MDSVRDIFLTFYQVRFNRNYFKFLGQWIQFNTSSKCISIGSCKEYSLSRVIYLRLPTLLCSLLDLLPSVNHLVVSFE